MSELKKDEFPKFTIRIRKPAYKPKFYTKSQLQNAAIKVIEAQEKLKNAKMNYKESIKHYKMVLKKQKPDQ